MESNEEELLQDEADFLVHAGIVVETKAVRTVAPEYEAQLFNDLRITRLQWSRRVL